GPAAREPCRVLAPRELVVRRADDGAAAQPRDRALIEHAAERARREEVAGGVEHRLGEDLIEARLFPNPPRLLGIELAEAHAGPGRGETLEERPSHSAHSLHEHGAAGA